jgi:UDP-N-acetylglucosamine 3-dehydrogenase
MVGHIERFNPAVTKLKEIVKQGQLGDITSIICRRVGVAPPTIKDAGVIIDLSVHDIDICNYLLDKTSDNLFAAGGSALINEREDYATIFLTYGMTNVVIQSNWITPIKIRTLNITGTKGYAELDYVNQRLHIYQAKVDSFYDDYGDFVLKFGTPATYEVEILKQEPLKLELEHFVNCVKNHQKPLVTGEDGLTALLVALDAQEKVLGQRQ